MRIAFRELYPELEVELKVALKEVATFVARDAESIAAFQGFAPPGTSGRGTGALIGSIRSGVTKHKAYIKESAENQGYYYPRLYEYARDRAFMRPAVNLNEARIYATVEAAVLALVSKFNG
jgi:hypothetical protein